ncbi:secreted Ly-6/uPAR-related protein 1 [Carlito syrichta]|uniref:Secreted Ly-6/uPAR-related protein 1 n=1 Tax=Carlito syrichta TaxID=1868482 RepID=A0A3Q0EBT9_CARSF|nr:secreted Ly-6/uPAR-related protein 1 [Carlito syrichta]
MSSRWALGMLLMAAWSIGCGKAFRCYTCEQPTTTSSCRNISYCKPEDTACKTTLVNVEAEYPFHQRPVVTRSCSTSCIATDPDSIGAAHLIFCCFRDLCNRKASVGLLLNPRGQEGARQSPRNAAARTLPPPARRGHTGPACTACPPCPEPPPRARLHRQTHKGRRQGKPLPHRLAMRKPTCPPVPVPLPGNVAA